MSDVRISAAALLFAGISAALQSEAQAVDTAEFCKVPAKPDRTTYWPSLMNAYPVTPPAEVLLLVPPSPQPPRCSVDDALKTGKPGHATFQETMAECGFATATTFALVFDEDDYCKVDDKAPYCTSLIDLRFHLAEKLNEADQGRGAPEQSGSYAFELGPTYRNLDRPARMRRLLLDIAAWSKPDAKTEANLLCSTPTAKPPKVDLPKRLAIAKDSKSVAPAPGYVRKLPDLKPLELAVNLDRENRTVTERDTDGNPVRSQYNDLVSVNGAIGYTLVPERDSGTKPNFWNDSLLTLYSSLNYAERFDPTKETDNFAFGFIAAPQLGLNNTNSPIANPRLDARWITDIEERDSAQWKVDIAAKVFALDTPDAWVAGSPILWTTEAVLDYSHVIFPGDKASLADVGEAFRVGYNIEWALRDTLFEAGNFAPTLSGAYKLRDTLGRGPGNADLVTIDLGLLTLDDKAGGLGLAIGYERGENINSLEEIEALKLKLQVKN